MTTVSDPPIQIEPPVIIHPPHIPPQLPPWIPPTQDSNPSGNDINGVATSVSERTLTISPWGKYVPIIFGEDIIGGMLSLIEVTLGHIYLRLVWCVGEVEEIVSVEFEDGTVPTGTVFNHYTGTSGQGIDPLLLALPIGYTDTLTNIGADNINLCYTVAKVPLNGLEGFPRFVARIKGMKMLSPVPKTKDTKLATGSEGFDTLTFIGNEISMIDANSDGILRQFIRYQEAELINNDDYNFEVVVTALTGIGSGNCLVQWCGNALIDDLTAVQMNTNALGTYNGTASFASYSSVNNFIRFDLTGADAGVTITYTVTIFNADGNAVKSYSEIAAVALNHLITDDQIGLGLTSNLESYVELINRNSQVLASGSFSESRSAIGLTINKKAQLQNHIEVLRGYARCTLQNNGEVYSYYALIPRDVTFQIPTSLIKPNTLKPVIKSNSNIPNIVRVFYTDTFTEPWKDNFVEVETAEVTSGAEYRRDAVYRMSGFKSRTAAKRFAFDRINERLRRFAVTFRTHEAVYDKQEGETFRIAHPMLGTSPIKMKLLAKKKINHSEWEIYAEQEDDSIYSNEIADFDPNAGDITLADPYDILEASGLTLSVETQKFQTAIYFSRLRVEWTLTAYIYNHFYQLELYEEDSNLLLGTQDLNAGINTAVFPNIQENVEYRVELKVVGFGGTKSTGITDLITPTGKDFPPTNVSGFNGFEVNGIVTLKWADAIDNDEVSFYFIQYGVSDFVWDDDDSRVLQSRIDAREIITNNVPAGTWDFLIKAVDNAGNLSVDATRKSDVIVTQNEGLKVSAFGVFGIYPNFIDDSASSGFEPVLADKATWGNINNTNIVKVNDYVTSTLDTWETMFPSAMKTYDSPLMTYGTGVANELFSEPFDFGSIIVANWTIDTVVTTLTIPEVSVLGGEVVNSVQTVPPTTGIDTHLTKIIQLSDDGVVWVDYDSLNITATGRHIRLKVTSPNLTARGIVSFGQVQYSIQRSISTQYYSGTTSAGTFNIALDDSTSDIITMTANINTVGANYAIIEKVGVAPWTQLKVSVYDNTGTLQTSPIDVSGEIRYI